MTEKLDKKRVFWGSAIILLVLLAFVCGICVSRCGGTKKEGTDSVKVVTKADVMMLISKTSKLYTAEVEAKKTMHYESDNSYDLNLFGYSASVDVPFGHMEAYIPVTAKYKASIDLSKIDSTSINILNDSTIQITLPDPVIEETACTVDHEKETVSRQIWAKRMDDETYQKIIRKAKDDIWGDITEDEYNSIIETAKVSATDMLLPMLRSLRFTNIQINYRNGLDTKHSSKLLERKKD